jgi:hypothetical protein
MVRHATSIVRPVAELDKGEGHSWCSADRPLHFTVPFRSGRPYYWVSCYAYPMREDTGDPMSFSAYLSPLLGACLLSASLLAVVLYTGEAGEIHVGGGLEKPIGPPAAPSQAGLYQVPYNGVFTFTRIRYGAVGSSRGGGFGAFGGSSAWNHDYPAADRNLQSLLAEFTYMRANTEGSNVLDLEDPRIFQHPILYMSEPGFWTATDEGARNLRAFLLKGGFLIFDDFEQEQWNNMAYQVRRALPEYDWFEIDGSHPLFRTFFGILDVYVPHPLVEVRPNYQVIFEDNDPAKRVMVLANHNSDLGEYWEWSARGQFGMAPTNDAYRLGVNYILYAVVH